MSVEPDWLVYARKCIGVREVPGKKHSSVILGWLKALKAWWADDETPWCGVFVGFVMRECGLDIPKYYMRAKDWAAWGVACVPQPGAVLVFERAGGGHVGMYVSESTKHYYVLGGNQGNAVSIVPIEKARCVAVRWPKNLPALGKKVVVADTGAKVSTNEA